VNSRSAINSGLKRAKTLHKNRNIFQADCIGFYSGWLCAKSGGSMESIKAPGFVPLWWDYDPASKEHKD
jgi:hypothetical protein